MKIYLLQALGVAPLKSKLEALGGWPLINSEGWKDDEFLWYGSLIDGIELNIGFMLTLSTCLVSQAMTYLHTQDHT